jgi:hypothetical protein
MTGYSRRRYTSLAGAALLVVAAACGDSVTAPGGETELISRVTLTLTPTGGGPSITTYIDDPDGNGVQPPSAQVGALSLAAGTTFTGTVRFENRLESPAEDITEEVEEEADEHRVLYTVTGAGLTISPTDVDGAGRPLGVAYTAAAGSTAGSGTLRVVLCHYGDAIKPAAATACTGDTDIDVSFTFTITN